MKAINALAGGLAGACVVTALHETIRRTVPNAPRMDLLGMRAIAKIMRKAGEEPPQDDELHTWALGGDIVSNSLYYSLVGTDKNAWLRGAFLGAAAGIGGVLLPGPLGLGEAPSGRTTQTKAMTIGLYFVGGMVAAAVGRMLRKK
jgi:hypothetical protein